MEHEEIEEDHHLDRIGGEEIEYNKEPTIYSKFYSTLRDDSEVF